jgi:hypothetical protein
MEEGWTWLINSKKRHYFRNGKSLCGKWACLGNDFTGYPDGIPCATCLKKRGKEMKGFLEKIPESLTAILERVKSQR